MVSGGGRYCGRVRHTIQARFSCIRNYYGEWCFLRRVTRYFKLNWEILFSVTVINVTCQSGPLTETRWLLERNVPYSCEPSFTGKKKTKRVRPSMAVRQLFQNQPPAGIAHGYGNDKLFSSAKRQPRLRYFRFACNISMRSVCVGAEPLQCFTYRCSSPRTANEWISCRIACILLNLSWIWG